MTIQKSRYGNTEFCLRGSNPKLLILSGMHGDEYEVIDCVKRYVNDHDSELPDFLCIPVVSPTAVKQRTRVNAWGRDVNRHFVDNSPDEEVRSVQGILSPYRFDLCVNFHEDPDHEDEFYVYDSGRLSDGERFELETIVTSSGATLFSGIDDTSDPALGNEVINGYVSIPPKLERSDDALSWDWLARHGIAKRLFDPEIPGKAPIALKQKLVNKLFPFFLSFLSSRL